ncbi:MAG TPA: hypothetical protein VEZ72_16000 [Paenibacillus sp.]|nr:hypothetical protein [Paenibacillus sp.]
MSDPKSPVSVHRFLHFAAERPGSQKPSAAKSSDSPAEFGIVARLGTDGSSIISRYVVILPFFAIFMTKRLPFVTEMLQKT